MPPSRRARIGIANEIFFGRDSIHFCSSERKMWNDASVVFGLLSAVGTISGKIYLRRLRGSRFARAAEDNAARGAVVRAAGCCPYDLQSCIVTIFYAVRRCGAAANCTAQRAAIFPCASQSRGRSDFGRRAAAAFAARRPAIVRECSLAVSAGCRPKAQSTFLLLANCKRDLLAMRSSPKGSVA